MYTTKLTKSVGALEEQHLFSEMILKYKDVDEKSIPLNDAIYLFMIRNMDFMPLLSIALIIGFSTSIFVEDKRLSILLGCSILLFCLFFLWTLHLGLNYLEYKYPLTDLLIGIPIKIDQTSYILKVGHGWILSVFSGILSIWYGSRRNYW